MSVKSFIIDPKSLGIHKTKKNSISRKSLQVSDNIIRNKLISKINDRKKQEYTDLKKTARFEMSEAIKSPTPAINSDEFSSAFEDLNNITKKLKTDSDKISYSVAQKRKHDELQRRTLKNSSIKIDVPDSLKPEIPLYLEPKKFSYNVDNAVPHGCLRDGLKPTYRSLHGTRRNPISSPISVKTTWVPPTKQEYQASDRSEKLENIRKKLRERTKMMNQENIILQQKLPPLPEEKVQDKTPYRKRTIKRTFTLGKSSGKKYISILLKDSATKKNIIAAQKELQATPIEDMKKYLRSHGILRAGTVAPAELIQNIYVNSCMTGDITNINNETMVENFLNPTDEVI